MRRTFWILLVLTVIAAGCSKSTTNTLNQQADSIRVVCTIGMLQDAVKEIGGDRVQVEALMGPGVDPHLYRATASDVSKLEQAQLIIFLGLELEGRMAEVLEKLAKVKPSRATGESVPKDELTQPAAFKGRYDPHVWFDVRLWKHVVADVRDALIEADPKGAPFYTANAKNYLAKLDELDSTVQAQIESIPQQNRVLITAHDAFGYFGKRYGLEVHGIQGMSTASEAGPADIRRLADLIVRKKVKSIFVETSVPKATIEALQKASGARGWKVSIGDLLFSDAMGQPGTPEGTYIGMVAHNVRAIVKGLK